MGVESVHPDLNGGLYMTNIIGKLAGGYFLSW
jgi:hypothetical protein